MHLCCLAVIVLCCTTPICCSEKPCAVFEFPAITRSGSTETLRDGYVAIPFKLRGEQCAARQDFKIFVKKQELNTTSDTVCEFEMADGRCFAARGDVCTCEPKNGVFLTGVSANQSDNTVWRWTSSHGVVEESEITLNLKCVSEFQTDAGPRDVTAVPGQDLQVGFPVRLHTLHIKESEKRRRGMIRRRRARRVTDFEVVVLGEQNEREHSVTTESLRSSHEYLEVLDEAVPSFRIPGAANTLPENYLTPLTAYVEGGVTIRNVTPCYENSHHHAGDRAEETPDTQEPRAAGYITPTAASQFVRQESSIEATHENKACQGGKSRSSNSSRKACSEDDHSTQVTPGVESEGCSHTGCVESVYENDTTMCRRATSMGLSVW
ncbi:hypothetical protein BaRGS_00036245 [Batillaria attramentaria]|uniref:Uncharacterized protein n=1 Tax=Batillaria attramentaria TaxID=370345 RepID=A0ABD0JCH0_9CAEN